MTITLPYSRDDLGKHLVKLHRDAQGNTITILLEGPPATGKTHTARAIAEYLGLTFFSVPCHEDMTQSEIIGGYAPVNGQWGYQLGPVLKAWADPNPKGSMLTFEDIHRAGGAFMSSAFLALDENRTVTAPHGESFTQPQGKVWCILTTNGSFDDLDEPIQSRIGFVFRVVKPSTKQLGSIQNDYIREACELDYAASESGEVLTADFRRWRSLDRTFPLVGLELALCGTVGDGRGDASQATIQRVVSGLAAAGMPEANALLAKISAGMASGAPKP